jgi:hypothetical protein
MAPVHQNMDTGTYILHAKMNHWFKIPKISHIVKYNLCGDYNMLIMLSCQPGSSKLQINKYYVPKIYFDTVSWIIDLKCKNIQHIVKCYLWTGDYNVSCQPGSL